MSAERVVVQRREGSGVCPYCRGDLGRGEALLVCEGCRATFHADCLRGLGRCTTLGCAGARALPRQEAIPEPAPAPARDDRGPTKWAVGLAWLSVMFLVVRLPLDTATTLAVGTLSGLLALAALAIDARRSGAAAGDGPSWPAPVVPPGPPRPPDPAARCPACDRWPPAGERVLRCEGCGADYHPACLVVARRCLRAGCAGRRAVPARARGA
ncbi:MAG: hypothetical protein KF878_34805 [Planctomycetes bacterium]|nr:hypothetical protein [Planctomycetota bacterium]